VLSFRLNYFLHGFEAWGFHAGNIVIYAISTLLVYHMAKQWLTNISGARVATILFTFHPIHVEAVASLVCLYIL
jgi:4-amino-4-deoxy-L-arabinose transferase-like glycosyltransferase